MMKRLNLWEHSAPDELFAGLQTNFEHYNLMYKDCQDYNFHKLKREQIVRLWGEWLVIQSEAEMLVKPEGAEVLRAEKMGSDRETILTLCQSTSMHIDSLANTNYTHMKVNTLTTQSIVLCWTFTCQFKELTFLQVDVHKTSKTLASTLRYVLSIKYTPMHTVYSLQMVLVENIEIVIYMRVYHSEKHDQFKNSIQEKRLNRTYVHNLHLGDEFQSISNIRLQSLRDLDFTFL